MNMKARLRIVPLRGVLPKPKLCSQPGAWIMSSDEEDFILVGGSVFGLANEVSGGAINCSARARSQPHRNSVRVRCLPTARG